MKYYAQVWRKDGLSEKNGHLEGVLAAIAFKHDFFDASRRARSDAVDRVHSEATKLLDELSSDYHKWQSDVRVFLSNTAQLADSAVSRAQGTLQQAIDNGIYAFHATNAK